MDARDEYDAKLKAGRHSHIIGADECGYGAWAGPLVVCACAAPVKWVTPKGLNDSKKVNAAKREAVAYDLKRDANLRFHVATADVEEIDRNGLGKTLKRCFTEVLAKLRSEFPEALVVVDGEVQLTGLSYLHFPRADGIVPAVMAASIYGKVLHDAEMIRLGRAHPGYGLGDHMGYGTEKHEDALRVKGKSPVHRKYTPMERILTGKRGQKIVDFDDDVEFE